MPSPEASPKRTLSSSRRTALIQTAISQSRHCECCAPISCPSVSTGGLQGDPFLQGVLCYVMSLPLMLCALSQVCCLLQ